MNTHQLRKEKSFWGGGGADFGIQIKILFRENFKTPFVKKNFHFLQIKVYV